MQQEPFTAAALLRQGKGLQAVCGNCRHQGYVNLLALSVAGRGDDDLSDLWMQGKFFCTRCGSHRCSLAVDP